MAIFTQPSASGSPFGREALICGWRMISGNVNLSSSMPNLALVHTTSRLTLRGQINKHIFIRDQTSPTDNFRPMPVKDRSSLPSARRKTGRGR